MNISLVKAFTFIVICFSSLILASPENTKIILPTQSVHLEDLNPQITQIDNAYFLVADAVKNSNSEKISTLLTSLEIKKVFTHQDVDQNLTDFAQTAQANTYKREKIRELLKLAIEEQNSARTINQLLKLFSENKNLNYQDKFEIYQDAKTIYKAAEDVLDKTRKTYQQLFNISTELPYEHQEQLQENLNKQLLNCVETLKNLVVVFATQKYADICHEYQDFDLTIWKLYKDAKELDYKICPFLNWNNVNAAAFAKAIEQNVESEFSFDKKLSDFVDGATTWIAKGILGAGIAGIIFLSWYFGSAASTR